MFLQTVFLQSHKDLSGDVVDNLRDFFKAMYKKVTSIISFLEYAQNCFACFLHLLILVTLVVYRSPRRILKCLRQTTGVLNPRRKTWLSCTRSLRVKWAGSLIIPSFSLLLCLWIEVNINTIGTDYISSRLFCSMLCSNPKLDSHRFKAIIDQAVAAGTRLSLAVVLCTKRMQVLILFMRYETIAGEVKSTKAYKKWAKEISEIEPPTNATQMRQK